MPSRRITLSLLLLLSFAARLPALTNPETTNSDAAIVGLQAMHVLRGEVSPLLWGSTYQTSVDVVVAAAFFAVFGASPVVLMLSALSLHAVSTAVIFVLLERALGRARALALSLLLVFTGSAIHSYALYPPRQAALTVGVCAIALLAIGMDARARRRVLMVGAAGALATFSLFADPYALLLLPGVAALAAVAIANARSSWWQDVTALLVGGVVGAIPLVLLVRHPSWRSGEASLSFDVLARNAKLLLSPCGPWAFNASVYRPLHVMDYVPWQPPMLLSLTMATGGVLLAAGCFVAPIVALSRAATVSPRARVLGLTGAAMTWGTLGGFLLSVMVMDHFSMRYLAAALIAAPLCLAPLAGKLSLPRLAWLLGPMLAAGGIAGIAALGLPVQGKEDERALLTWLDREGVRFGVADYWVAYRLTFVAGEHVVVVPTHRAQDRRLAYRELVARAPQHAYIVDALRSDERADAVEARLRSQGKSFRSWTQGTLTTFLVEGPLRDASGVRSD